MDLLIDIVRLVVVAGAAAIAIFLALVMFEWLTPGIDEWEQVAEGNWAVGAVMGAVAVATALVMRPIVAPSLRGLDVGAAGVARSLALEGFRALMGMVLAILSVTFAGFLYNVLTGTINERAELRRGNAAVGVVQAGVILGVALLISAPAATLAIDIVETLFR